MVGNGPAQTCELVTTAGTVEVSAPRVDDRREGERFTSSILLPYLRRSARVIELVHAAVPARAVDQRLSRPLRRAPSAPAPGPPRGCTTASTCTSGRAPPGADTKPADPLWLLVIVGVRPDRTKELVTVSGGHREVTDSWAEVLHNLRERG